ncbi:MAG: trypsin-like peptidase domain-containing protein [Candidatus Nealsonbacteria bacterium]|nr:trypsin-like peptidase domain-containing protein [Candidatus Nealsonbacteria bacterium]
MKISEIIEKNKKSIVLLEILIPKDNNQATRSVRGTGFVISADGKFITNNHVYQQVADNERQHLRVMVPGKTDEKGIVYYDGYRLELLKKDEENDLALMKIIAPPEMTFSPVNVGKPEGETIKEGEEVLFLGYPLATELMILGFGITLAANHCVVSAIKRKAVDGSLHFFMVDTHINNGSSGSPVFSVETGKIVGVASGRISAKVPLAENQTADIPANMGICRSSKYITNLTN